MHHPELGLRRHPELLHYPELGFLKAYSSLQLTVAGIILRQRSTGLPVKPTTASAVLHLLPLYLLFHPPVKPTTASAVPLLLPQV